jgi:hypothetical protein
MRLTKHEGETFTSQTVYISGQAFVRCNFVACTLVLRETIYYMEGCTFERCNWHLDCILPWDSREAVNAVQVIMDLVRQGQTETEAAGAGDEAAGAAGNGGSTTPPPGSPFA